MAARCTAALGLGQLIVEQLINLLGAVGALLLVLRRKRPGRRAPGGAARRSPRCCSWPASGSAARWPRPTTRNGRSCRPWPSSPSRCAGACRAWPTSGRDGQAGVLAAAAVVAGGAVHQLQRPAGRGAGRRDGGQPGEQRRGLRAVLHDDARAGLRPAGSAPPGAAPASSVYADRYGELRLVALTDIDHRRICTDVDPGGHRTRRLGLRQPDQHRRRARSASCGESPGDVTSSRPLPERQLQRRLHEWLVGGVPPVISVVVISKDEASLDETLTDVAAQAAALDQPSELVVVDASRGRLDHIRHVTRPGSGGSTSSRRRAWTCPSRISGTPACAPRAARSSCSPMRAATPSRAGWPPWSPRCARASTRRGPHARAAGPGRAIRPDSPAGPPVPLPDRVLHHQPGLPPRGFRRRRRLRRGLRLRVRRGLQLARDRCRLPASAACPTLSSGTTGDVRRRQLRRSYVYGRARARLYRKHPAAAGTSCAATRWWSSTRHSCWACR